VRVLIVDDHEPVRRGIRSLLARHEDWSVCGEAADGVQAVELARQLRPDVILMDMSMPRMDGAAASRVIRQEVPEAQIIIVTQNDPVLVRQYAAEIGARGYVSKATLARDLLPAILEIIGGPSENKPAFTRQGEFAENQWLFGGGDLGHLIRQHDWSSTPLGPIPFWPQSLKTAVNLMLNSQHPIWIGWGPEMTFLYNDAYISVLSLAKHPGSLGRPASEVWAEIWPYCGPLAERVFVRGEASYVNDVQLFMSRGEYLEETYYSFSYSAIYDESGKVAGLFCPSTETTAKVLHTRRLRTLSELSAKALLEKSSEAACASAIETISQNPDDIPFSLLYLLSPDRNSATLESAGVIAKGVAGVSPREISVSGSGESGLWPIREIIETSQPSLVSVAAVSSLPLGPGRRPVGEAFVLPVSTPGQSQPIGVLIVGVNPTRKLDAEYRTFFSLIADQVGTAIQNARAAEEEKRRAEALAEIDRAKTLFFSNVSHEFRTPLTLMLAPLEDILGDAHELSPEYRERLQMAHRNSLRLLKLVNTLLDFSRIEAGRMQAVYQPTELSTLTAELAGMFQSATERAGLRLIVNCSPLAQPVYIDQEMWEKIVFNLLSNAFKFTFDGEIEVAVREVAGAAQFSVRDTGIGIAEREIPLLFQRFYRVKGARGRTFEGSGIGLSLVDELVRLHGGTVSVQSQPNLGSTFTIAIPFGKDHLPADRIEAPRTLESTALRGDAYVQEALRWLPGSDFLSEELPATVSAAPANTLPHHQPPAEPYSRILVADDNADMREYVQRLLSGHYKVEFAADGESALGLARQHPPDLILADVMMPRLDGFALLRAVRGDETLKSTPVILLSARAGEEARIEGFQSGADDYLVKPFSARELMARVRAHLAMARFRQEAAALERRLRLDAELLAAIVASSDDAMIRKDMDGKIMSWNKGAERIFGYTASEAVGQHITLIIPPERRDEETNILSRLRQGEHIDHFHTVRVRKDGSAVDVSLSISPIRDSSGRIVGASKVARDVSAQVRSEKALRESEERFRMAQAAANVGTWEWDPAHNVHVLSPELNFMFGTDPEEADQSKTWAARLHPEDVAHVRRSLEEAEATGEMDFEYRYQHPTLGLRWFNSKGRRVGRGTRMFGVLLDITDRKLAEERERQITSEAVQATAKFRAVFEQTTQFAGIMTLDGSFIEANRLCLDACGYRAEEVLGRPFWETAWWRNFPESQEKIRAATPLAAQGLPYREILHYSLADGTERLLDFALYPIFDDHGGVLYLHPTGVDITEIKRAEENYRRLAETLELEVRARTLELETRNAEILRQADLVRDFSQRLMQAQDEERRRIARELHDSAGQTLTVLGISLAQLVQKAGRGAPQLASDAEMIQEAVQQLHREIRTTSYLLHPPLLDENGLVSALQWYVQGLSERSGVEIQLEIAEDFGRLPRDLELVVFRVVQESLTNIHRHSGSKTARIRIAREAEAVSVEVQDEGGGMPPEKLAEIHSGRSGVGIRGMRERIRQFEGLMNIESSNSGTRIAVAIPIPVSAPIAEAAAVKPLRAAR
jgi:PAS domain S-box-containing protein